MHRYSSRLTRGWLDVRKSKGENNETEGWKRSTSDKLAGIGAECGGVTRGEVWISWIGNGADKIVSGIRSGGMRHMLGVGREEVT